MPKAPTKTATAGRPPVLVDLALLGVRVGCSRPAAWKSPGCASRRFQSTSAGAMNAAVMAADYAKGGAPAARTALDAFWTGVSRAAVLNPLQCGPIDKHPTSITPVGRRRYEFPCL